MGNPTCIGITSLFHPPPPSPTPPGGLNWAEICRASTKVITFIDLAGHEKYLKTTVFGMTGHAPDFCMMMVGANAGMIGMTKGVCVCVCVCVCTQVFIYGVCDHLLLTFIPSTPSPILLHPPHPLYTLPITSPSRAPWPGSCSRCSSFCCGDQDRHVSTQCPPGEPQSRHPRAQVPRLQEDPHLCSVLR